MRTDNVVVPNPFAGGLFKPPVPPVGVAGGTDDGSWWRYFGQMLKPEDLEGLLCVSRAQFFRHKSAGRILDPVMFGRLPRWPLFEVVCWQAAGCPDAERWRSIRKLWLGLDSNAA